jgi:regulator of cell morphogenesis and NO signaling
MKITPDREVREIASQIQASMPLFDTLRIDYCCNGQRSLKEACSAAGIPLERVMDSLDRMVNRTPSNPDAPIPWAKKSIPELIGHILETHHEFTKVQLKRLVRLSEKVSREHGIRYPELIRLHGLLATMAGELQGHMIKEEEVVFPYLLRLWDSKQKNKPLENPFSKEVFQENPVNILILEHGMTGEEWQEIHHLTREYTTPADACGSYRSLYQGLKELEDDLHRHIHLENNILFYRLQEMGLLV